MGRPKLTEEEIKEQGRVLYNNHWRTPEQIEKLIKAKRARQRKYYYRNKERLSAKSRSYYAQNKKNNESYKEKNKIYCKERRRKEDPTVGWLKIINKVKKGERGVDSAIKHICSTAVSICRDI